MLKIFLNTWGNYNENGADGGEWIELPMSAEELEEARIHIAEAMGDNDPEWFINDYEWEKIEFGQIGENDSIDELNELVERLDYLYEWEQKEVAAAIEALATISKMQWTDRTAGISCSLQTWTFVTLQSSSSMILSQETFPCFS